MLSDLSNVRNVTSTPAKAKAEAMEARTPATRQPLSGTPGSTNTLLPQEEGSTFKTRKQVLHELTRCTLSGATEETETCTGKWNQGCSAKRVADDAVDWHGQAYAPAMFVVLLQSGHVQVAFNDDLELDSAAGSTAMDVDGSKSRCRIQLVVPGLPADQRYMVDRLQDKVPLKDVAGHIICNPEPACSCNLMLEGVPQAGSRSHLMTSSGLSDALQSIGRQQCTRMGTLRGFAEKVQRPQAQWHTL